MRWRITENEECECPGFTVDILPNKLPAHFHVLLKESRIYLQADGLAGIIPCSSGNSILIEPKCKGLHPFAMYEYINNLSLVQSPQASVDIEASGIDLQTLARYFATELIAIQCRHRMFKRLPTNRNRSVVKGNVDWVATSRKLASNKSDPIVSMAMEATHDIPENEAISMASRVCLPLFEIGSNEWIALHSWSELSYKKLLTKEQLIKLQGTLRNSNLSGAHSYYYTPVALALVILGINDTGNTSMQEQSILFNMPGLYEDYIRTAFMRRSIIKGYSCQKSFVPKSFLFSNGSCKLEPDITIYDGNRPIAILDVKYKTPDSKDYYQIFTYMKYAGLTKAFVISPYVRNNETVTAYDGTKIVGIQVSKSSHTDLEAKVSGVIDSL